MPNWTGSTLLWRCSLSAEGPSSRASTPVRMWGSPPLQPRTQASGSTHWSRQWSVGGHKLVQEIIWGNDSQQQHLYFAASSWLNTPTVLDNSDFVVPIITPRIVVHYFWFNTIGEMHKVHEMQKCKRKKDSDCQRVKQEDLQHIANTRNSFSFMLKCKQATILLRFFFSFLPFFDVTDVYKTVWQRSNTAKVEAIILKVESP